jgi:hypothetical protein
MWVVRELILLIARIVGAFLVALLLAVLWAVVSEHSFSHDLYVTTLAIGCALLLMGAIGRGSNFDRGMDASVTQAVWGRIPGVSTLNRRGEDPTLNPGAVFVLSGLALLGFAFFAVGR